MSAVAEAPPRLFELGSGPVRPRGGSLTLEQKLDRALEALHTEGAAECPVCRSRMVGDAEGGRCAGCGSQLS